MSIDDEFDMLLEQQLIEAAISESIESNDLYEKLKQSSLESLEETRRIRQEQDAEYAELSHGTIESKTHVEDLDLSLKKPTDRRQACLLREQAALARMNLNAN